MSRARGFTLLEVLVALVIVAFGMGAVLSALSSSADNIAALREKTLAEWVGMNQIADVRLNLTPPQPGVTEGDIHDFGGGNWHWRQDVIAVSMVPGLLEIAVRVRRVTPGAPASKPSSSPRATTPAGSRSSSSSGSSSSGAPGSFFSSSSGAFSSSGGSASGASSGIAGGHLGLSSSSGAMNGNIGASQLPATGDDQHWVATVIGFKGDAVAQASGEAPDWQSCNGGSFCTSGASSSSSGSSGSSSSGVASSSSGAIIGPNSGSSGSSQTSPTSSSSGSTNQ